MANTREKRHGKTRELILALGKRVEINLGKALGKVEVWTEAAIGDVSNNRIISY